MTYYDNPDISDWHKQIIVGTVLGGSSLVKPKKGQKISMKDAHRVYKLMWGLLEQLEPFDKEKEHFWVIGLNRAMNVKYLDWISMGSMHGTVAEPREIFRNAVLYGASSIILSHNHPSGNIKPSREDIEITKLLVEGGELLRIKVLDHVIVVDGDYYSFNDEGIL